MHYVYVLIMSNKQYYVGSTTDLKKRVLKHNEGGVPSTAKFRPVSLVWYAGFSDRKRSIEFEDYLKTASGKAFRNKHLV